MTATRHLRFQVSAQLLAQLLALLVALALLFLARPAKAEKGTRYFVDLLTVGPHDALASRFGHSLLCVRTVDADEPEKGRCFDYGVADRDDMVHAVWTSLRSTPSFIPVAVFEHKAIEFFKGQGRGIERQRLPLTTDEAARLVRALEDDVNGKRAFAYHPYFANCSTRLRDHIDAATNGRLRPGPSQIPPGGFRDYMEEGHSGRLGILLAMALYLGETNDHHPTPWEAMLLPTVLRDGVAERFQVQPEKVSDRVAHVLPTSRAAGRIAVIALAFVLFSVSRFLARRRKVGLGLRLVGGTLGVLAVSVELAALVSAWPEIRQNWALLLLLPTDLALPFLGRRLPLYVKARLGMAALFALLEIVGVIHQPMLHLVALVALPLGGLLSAIRTAEAPTPTTSAPAAA